jgi:hypothetical protein
MPGVYKKHRTRDHGRAFPASRYNDPRGGRASGLERNNVRYRAIEATLYLFYSEDVRDFMMANIYRRAITDPAAEPWAPAKDRRLEGALRRLLMDAELAKTVSIEDAQALRQVFAEDRKQGKKLKVAFGHAVKTGMVTEAEANELQDLLDYRNDIAHRIHLVMSDVSRTAWATDHLAYTAPAYNGGALDKLRAYRRSLWDRTHSWVLTDLSWDSMLFELAEKVLEDDLKRLDHLIQAQIRRERARAAAINAELDLRGTELVGDLSPRFPPNHRPNRSYGDDYEPPTGHLTERGVEICYRLFDLGKSPIAVAYLMGISLRAAANRQKGWTKAGGALRQRAEIRRYDLTRRRPAAPADSAAAGG